MIDHEVWATAWAWYPERVAGHWKTHQKQPVLAVGFASVINKHSGWIEEQLKPAISTEKKSCVTQLQWRPRPGQWCSQGRKFRAVAETCSHYPRRMLLAVAGQLTQEAKEFLAQRLWGLAPWITSKLCRPHRNLRTPRTVGTLAVLASCVSFWSCT